MLGSVVWKSAGIQYPKSVPMIIVFKIQKDELELKIITWKPFCLNKRQEKIEEAIKNGQSLETGNTRYTRHRTQDQDKKNTTQKTNNMRWTPLYTNKHKQDDL